MYMLIKLGMVHNDFKRCRSHIGMNSGLSSGTTCSPWCQEGKIIAPIYSIPSVIENVINTVSVFPMKV